MNKETKTESWEDRLDELKYYATEELDQLQVEMINYSFEAYWKEKVKDFIREELKAVKKEEGKYKDKYIEVRRFMLNLFDENLTDKEIVEKIQKFFYK